MGRNVSGLLCFAVLAMGCRGEVEGLATHAHAQESAQARSNQRAQAGAAENAAPRQGQAAAQLAFSARPGCPSAVPVFEDGRESGSICEDDAASHGLTVLDLSNDWAPWVFEGHEGQQPVAYRRVFTRLADEQGARGTTNGSPEDRYVELYGIFPTFRVLRARMLETQAHACSAAIDDAPLRGFSGSINRRNRRHPAANPNLARTAEALLRQLEREVGRRGLSGIAELEHDRRMGRVYAQYREVEGYMQVIRTLQAHLRCEGLLGNARAGVFDAATAAALTTWQRKNMRVSRGYFDEPSRDFMLLSSEERVFQAVLRALRERVVDATGLIEDGSASAAFGSVLGRDLNTPELEATAAYGPIEGAAPDRISGATEAAARALGLVDPAAAAAVLGAKSDMRQWRVATRLPPLPEYYSEHMELRAEIDRGDVRRGPNRPGDRRPATTLFVRHEGRDIALVRWSTTIGGYQSELREDGSIGTEYKESPAGPVIWRDVVAAPSWMPPPSTPDDELVSRGRVNRSIVGPGYRSAYGLLMVMHHEVLPPGRDGQPRFRDEGVRSHGSVSYHSILEGFSHGCHRLFNHLALRLGGFLVRHRRHVVRGNQPVEYLRTLLVDGAEEEIRIDTRGYLYELTPPVDVNVLRGTVH